MRLRVGGEQMVISELVLLVGALTSVAAVGATAWKMRRGGPESQAQMVTASTLLLEQLQRRITALEQRTAALELENAAHELNLLRYAEAFGPLPDA